MKKINETHIVIFVVVILLTIFFILLSNRKREDLSPIQIEIQKLQNKIDKQERIIHDMLIEIKMHSDTVYFYEQKKPIITNNYFENEKIILTASDSSNASMRFRNQLEFERRYFKGRYTPVK
jgi:sensor domain CHASE-containing protein